METPKREPSEITEEEVDAVHARYMEALQNLFDTYKDEYGGADQQLVIKEAANHHSGHAHGKKKSE